MGHHHIADCTPPHSRLHTPPYNFWLLLTGTHKAVAFTLPYNRLHTTIHLLGHLHTIQPLPHYHAAACILPGSHFHSTMQLLAHYHTSAWTLLCSYLHTIKQPLAHYHAAACTLNPNFSVPNRPSGKSSVLNRIEFPELFKTHLIFIFLVSFVICVVIIASSNIGRFLGGTLYMGWFVLFLLLLILHFGIYVLICSLHKRLNNVLLLIWKLSGPKASSTIT